MNNTESKVTANEDKRQADLERVLKFAETLDFDLLTEEEIGRLYKAVMGEGRPY